MADITAAQVKELRDATNVSMMECKRALVESDGNIDAATKLLREKGIAIAAKKASRTANQGLIASAISDDGKTKSLVLINCETDFVARNDSFINFVAELAAKACDSEDDLSEVVKDEVIAKVAEIGENIIVSKNTRFTLEGNGDVVSYIHLGGKVGVLIDVACEKPETAQNEVFKELAKDLSLHVAASNPSYLQSSDVPESEIADERDIFAKQVEGKPAEIIDKIVDGKINKYFAEICLLDQGFVREPKQSITQLLEEKSKEIGDTISIRKYVRYQMGA